MPKGIERGESRDRQRCRLRKGNGGRKFGQGVRRTAASSAQALGCDISTPTTLVPGVGPEPSAAACSTTPAKSHPRRVPAAPWTRYTTSLRFSEMAFTRITASLACGVGGSIVWKPRRTGACGSTTMACMLFLLITIKASNCHRQRPGSCRSDNWPGALPGAGWLRQCLRAGPRAAAAATG